MCRNSTHLCLAFVHEMSRHGFSVPLTWHGGQKARSAPLEQLQPWEGLQGSVYCALPPGSLALDLWRSHHVPKGCEGSLQHWLPLASLYLKVCPGAQISCVTFVCQKQIN